MTRRLTLAIISTVLISVLLAGLGTVALTRVEDRRARLNDLEATAEVLAFVFSETPLTAVGEPGAIRERLARIQAELRIADAELLIINRDGDVFGEVPIGLEDARIDLEALRTEGRIGGTSGGLVYAAAYGTRNNFDYVIVLTADANRITGPVVRWIALSAVVAILAGALIAWILGRRLSRPILDAATASHQIADGDLSVRVDVDEKRHDELSELGTSVNHMAESLERARGLERQFLLSVSHDLRTPLTSIRGYAEAIGDGTASDNGRAADIIQTEARRLERLVTDLLDLAKLDARQFRFETRPVDLAELVPDVAAGFEREAQRHGLAVRVDGPAGGVTAVADPDRLAQVIANLVENAIKFAESQVSVSYRSVDGGAEIVVADDGPGVATEDLPHVFERLYVASQTPKRRETGSGLGLAIVKELVEAQRGTVAALPRPTGGTAFVITLGR